MYDAEGNLLAPGDVVLFVHQTDYKTALYPGIIDHIDNDIAHILDMTLTYRRRKRAEEIILRTSSYRGVNPSLIAELYNTTGDTL